MKNNYFLNHLKENDKFLEGHSINRDEFDYDVMRQVEGVLNSR